MKYLFTMLLLFVSQAAITQTSLLQTYCYLDYDGDGYGDPNTGVPTPIFGCSFIAGGSWVSNGSDCDDHNLKIHPGTVWYKDADNDGFSNGTTITGCMRPPGGYKYAAELRGASIDCDDNDRYVRPGQAWFSDADNDGYTNDPRVKLVQCTKPAGNYVSETQLMDNGSIVLVSCGTGCSDSQIILLDCNDNDPLEHPNQKWYIDVDGDKYTSNFTPIVQCTHPAGGYAAEPELASSTNLDCDDANPGITDAKVWYKDADNDGFTDGATLTQCSRPANYKLKSEILVDISTTQPLIDCDDDDDVINPGTSWYKDVDGDKYGAGPIQFSCTRPADHYLQSELISVNDCNDNDPNIGFPKWYSLDADHDGYGEITGTLYLLCAATAPEGYASNNTDCNDNDVNIHPGATEICDGIDNDCNGLTDEGFTDTDNDGQANCVDTDDDNDGIPDVTDNCPLIANANQANTDNDAMGNACDPDDDNDGVLDGLDCDPLNAAVWQSATLYRDADGDGYTAGNGEVKCYGAVLPAGWLAVKSSQNDCNDNDPAVNPGAVEVCGNKIDDNCNGQVDEVVCYACRNATAFSTTNITANSATVNWVSVPNPEQWQLQYKPTAPGGKWIDVILTGNKRSYTITGLASRQTYNWHIKAKCGKNWTEYSSAIVFVTLAGSENRYIVTADEAGTNEVAMRNELYKKDIATAISLQVSAMPNPTSTNFKLAIRGNDQKDVIKISVTDIYGRVIEERILPGEQVITLGDKYRPGVYMVRIIQGKQSRQLKLIKL